MKTGLIGINSIQDKDKFLRISEALNKNLHGIFAPHSDDIVPIIKSVKIENFPSASEMFDKVDAVYFANSLKLNYDFAIAALKKSCNLFIEDVSELGFDEIKQLFKIAFEGRTKVHIRHNKIFTSEYLELTDYIDNPKLIEINKSYTSLLRKNDYFSELFNNLHFADILTNSTIKKISTIALPVDQNHFSLIHVNVNYDNGTTVNIKLNNLTSNDNNEASIYQKNEIIKLNFIKHFAVRHKFENGQVIRTEHDVENKDTFLNELTHFINICNNDDSSNSSESPSILKTIQNTHLVMHELDQVSQKI